MLARMEQWIRETNTFVLQQLCCKAQTHTATPLRNSADFVWMQPECTHHPVWCLPLWSICVCPSVCSSALPSVKQTATCSSFHNHDRLRAEQRDGDSNVAWLQCFHRVPQPVILPAGYTLLPLTRQNTEKKYDYIGRGQGLCRYRQIVVSDYWDIYTLL